MDINTTLQGIYFMPLILGFISLCILLLGARGVITKKPFVVSSRAMFALLVLNFSPMILTSIGSMFSEYHEFGWLDLAIPMMYVVLLIFLWMQMRGFSIFGVSEDSLRLSLHNTLRRLNIPFEERLSKIRLLDTDADLQVNVQARMGVAAISIKPPTERETLRRIVTTLRDEFAQSSFRANLTTCYFHIALGLLMLALSYGLFSMTRSMNQRHAEYEQKYGIHQTRD